MEQEEFAPAPIRVIVMAIVRAGLRLKVRNDMTGSGRVRVGFRVTVTVTVTIHRSTVSYLVQLQFQL